MTEFSKPHALSSPTSETLLLKMSKGSALRYAQAMVSRDRFHSFDALNDTLDKLYQSVGSDAQAIEQAMMAYLVDSGPKLSRFMHQLIALGFLNRQRSPVCPPGYYFINDTLRVVYCAIPKNACTLFKTMVVEHGEDNSAFISSEYNIHQFLNRRAGDTSASHLLNCLTSEDYFKFTVLRNPLNRIVSGYLDKFAKHAFPEAFVREIIAEVQATLGEDEDIEKSITFSEFVDYLVRTPDTLLNDHWRPQHNFTAAVKFDYIGQFEAIDNVISTLEEALNIEIRKQVSNHITEYAAFESNLAFHHMHPSQLRALGKMPLAAHLLTQEISSKLQARYQQDVELYCQQVKTPAARADSFTHSR